MKSFTPIVLGAFLAVAAAAPLEKRDYTSTVIVDVTETVDVITTVYVQPGDPRLTLNQQVAAPTSASTTPVVAQSSSTPVSVPQQNVQAAYVAPAPTTTPPPTSTAAPIVSVTPSSTPAVVAQPQIKAVAPIQAAVVPAAAPVADTAATGGACGTKGGNCVAESVTTFDGTVAPGSCGWMDPDRSPNYFALAHGMMGEQSNGNPNCGRTAEINYNGKTFTALLTDKCMGCDGASIDLSPALFESMFGMDTGRFHNIDWHFTS